MLIAPPPIVGNSFVTAMSGINAATAVASQTTLGNDYTLVTKYNTVNISNTGTPIRIVVESAPTGDATITETWIGNAASTGDAWDFAASPAPVQVKWNNGSSSLSLVKGGNRYYSDETNFEITDTVPVIVAMNVSNGSVVKYRTGLNKNIIVYNRAGVSQAGLTNKTGTYVGLAGASYFINSVQTAGIREEQEDALNDDRTVS